MMVVQYSTAVWFPFAVLSTAKGKLIHSANFAPQTTLSVVEGERAVKNILSLTRIAKLEPSRTAGRLKGVNYPPYAQKNVHYAQNRGHKLCCIYKNYNIINMLKMARHLPYPRRIFNKNGQYCKEIFLQIRGLLLEHSSITLQNKATRCHFKKVM